VNACPIQFVLGQNDGFDRGFPGPTVWVVPQRSDALARVLAAHLDVPAERLGAVERDIHGRPQLCTDGSLPARDFSVASASERLVVAVAPEGGGRIGVDAEPIRADLDPLIPARDQFTCVEFARLSSLAGAAERLAAFYDMWTAKEALAKAIGHGFSLGLDAIETAPYPCPTAWQRLSIRRLAGRESLAAGWRVFHRQLGELLIAVAWG
jgi:4'-phosphopantetheinyl transferase